MFSYKITEKDYAISGESWKRSLIPTVILQANLREYLNAKSPLRTECKILLTGSSTVEVKSTENCYVAMFGEDNNFKIVTMENIPFSKTTIPVSIEVASNPEDSKLENLYDIDKIGKVFVEEEKKIFDLISEKTGNEILFVIRTDVTVLPADYYDKDGKVKLYGLSIFEQFGVIKGTNLEIAKSPIK